MTDGSLNPPGGSGAPPPPPPPAAYPAAPTFPSQGIPAPPYATGLPPATPPKKDTPKWVVPVVLIAVVAVVGALVLAVRSDGDSSDEMDGVRDGFVEECVNTMERSTCECWWDELLERFTPDELLKLGLSDTSDPASDEKIRDAYASCT